MCILEMRKLRIEIFMRTETTWPGSGRAENRLPGESASSNRAALLLEEGLHLLESPHVLWEQEPT